MLVVFGVIAAALLLFVAQPIPIDTTAIALMVALILLEPWTGVAPADGVSGFSNPATVTVLAMFVLSEGVRQTGAIQILTRKVSAYTGDDETKQLLAVVGLSGPPAGFVNNTPIVAVLIPAIHDLAKKANTSPSTLLMPLSFAAMMGGTLTLIGTSSNLLASDVWARQGGPGAEPFGMFEFTQLGIVVLAVGVVYLLTVGRYLTPARIEPSSDLGEEFGVSEYLTDVVVREESPLIGTPVRAIRRDDELDLDVFQIVRNGRTITRGIRDARIRAGDILAVRTDEETLQRVLAEESLDLLPEVIDEFDEEESERIKRAVVSELDATTPTPESDREADASADDAEEPAAGEQAFAEVALLPGSWLSGRTFRVTDFQRRHDVTVLAVRRGNDVIRQRMRDLRLRGGDTLLVRTTESTLAELRADRSLIVSGDGHWESFDRRKIPVALGIVGSVVGLAAFDLVPIMVGALAGIVAMIVTGCLRPADAYEAVSWDVIFLLAGVIPLGIAMEESGAAAFLGERIVGLGGLLSPLILLGAFYLFTALLTNLISNNASVVLMIPVAIDAATAVGANPFSFVLAVTFAASTAFMTPVGYQTNLMVYGPGGYRFSDFVRVGLPLQLLLTVVTPLGIAFFWGV
ncbi:sodium-coupled transporter [Halorubrum sp. CBA1125]|nr:sodium-coupled transporter [Halorubrum sp. CBA1125]